MKPVKEFDSPCVHPNGLQWVDGELYVIDQKSDDVFVLNERGETVRTLGTPTENGSGVTVGNGFLWTASNGKTVVREPRPTDTGLGWVLKLNPRTGELIDRFRTPDGGGIHGVEWDDGNIWLTAFNPTAITLVDGDSHAVLASFPIELPRLHGLAREGDGIWCAHTGARLVVKYDVESGHEIDRIAFGPDDPFPHGLSIRDGELWYADADYRVAGFEGTWRGWPEIGRIVS